MTTKQASAGPHFIRQIIDKDRAEGRHGGQVVTRFPPEPNGYLHIGHSKSICLNFGLARDYGGRCHLRMDDTNPLAEDPEYVEAIKADVRWLGFDWGERLYNASDYFQRIYDYTVELVRKGLAYVDDSSVEDIRRRRGSLTEPGQDSPFRDRSVDENLRLLEAMKNGEFADGSRVLRARIDMRSPNMNMRDPILYRIRKTVHHRTGSAWNIYPMYDYAHPISDAIEGVTHSICTLEFEDHRPLYEWTLRALQTPAQPQQIEFARLNIDYTVMSKRRLLQLVQDKLVDGWDDPRMPTIKGMRRRGYRPQAIRNFADRVGVTRKNSVIALSTLEHAVREDLDEHSARAFAVLRPVRVRLTNYPGEGTEILRAPRHPKYPERGEREIPFGRELWIEEDDFAENPPPGFQRLRPGGRVRLRYAFVIRCEEVIKDPTGRVVEIRCAYEPDTKGGVNPPGRPKPDGIIHWVEVSSALRAEVRLYDRLFSDPSPDMHEGKDFREFINRDSLTKLTEAVVEPSVGGLPPESHVQFERLGFFCTDMVDHDPERRRVFNRTVTLRDTWAVTAPKGPL